MPTLAATSKLSLPLSALQRAMSLVAPAIERKTTIPVLSNVWVEQADGHLDFIGTNLDLTIRVRVTTLGAESAKPMLLPALKLESFAKLLQGDTVSVKLTGDQDQRAEIRCGRSNTRIPNSSPANFPAVSFGSQEQGVMLTQGEATRLLGFTTFAISEEESRYTINAGMLEIVDGKLCLVATDGHRLARYTVPTNESAVSIVMPAAMLRAVQKSVDEDAPALLSVSEADSCVFANLGDATGEVALTHRKISGQFPNYRRIMPQGVAATIRVDADAMKASLRRCLTFADERSNAVAITFGLDEIKMRGASSDNGETDEFVDVLSASTGADFKPFTVGFSGRYLVDGFSRLSGPVDMRFTHCDNQHSMMIYAEPVAGEVFEYVVMPMRV